jgi:AraC-like DNA-binding protein
MTYEDFASDLPLDQTIVFTSPEENEETMRRFGVNQRVRQLGKGKFRCDMAVRSTQQADLFADRFNRAFSIFLEPPAGTFDFLFFRSATGRFLASGEDAANDRLVVLPPGSGTDLVAPDLAGSEAFTVPEARIIEMTETLCPAPKSVLPERMTVIGGNTARLHALRKAVLDLLRHPERDPNEEQISNLIAETIAWMRESSDRWRPERLRVGGARRRVAKLTQEYIEEHHHQTVRLEDLCRVTGVRVRTLQRCFREYFGITITGYLKALRLDAARRQLRAARNSQESVTSIALQHGITHLGRFSVEFRERFGESPSETLATRAGRKS